MPEHEDLELRLQRLENSVGSGSISRALCRPCLECHLVLCEAGDAHSHEVAERLRASDVEVHPIRLCVTCHPCTPCTPCTPCIPCYLCVLCVHCAQCVQCAESR